MAIIYKDGKPVVVAGGEAGGASGHTPGSDLSDLPGPEMTRRRFMRGVFLGTMGAFLAGATGTYLLFFWPKKVGTFGSTIKVGDAALFPQGTVTRVADGRFYLVHTTPE